MYYFWLYFITAGMMQFLSPNLPFLTLSFLDGLKGQPAQQANLSWCGVPEELHCIEW